MYILIAYSSIINIIPYYSLMEYKDENKAQDANTPTPIKQTYFHDEEFEFANTIDL